MISPTTTRKDYVRVAANVLYRTFHQDFFSFFVNVASNVIYSLYFCAVSRMHIYLVSIPGSVMKCKDEGQHAHAEYHPSQLNGSSENSITDYDDSFRLVKTTI